MTRLKTAGEGLVHAMDAGWNKGRFDSCQVAFLNSKGTIIMNLPLRVERASNAFYPAWNLRDPYDNLIAQDMLEDDAEYLAALANADHAKAKKPKAKKKEQPHA